jgi:hypothetical protein
MMVCMQREAPASTFTQVLYNLHGHDDGCRIARSSALQINHLDQHLESLPTGPVKPAGVAKEEGATTGCS